MNQISKKEWVAVFVAVIFVGYTLFGGNLSEVLNKVTVNNNENQLANVNDSNNQPNTQVITNDITVGTGPEAMPGKLLSVHYILSLEDGTLVQNSKDFGDPFQFILGTGSVIPGWEIGVNGMKAGGVRTLVIPSDLAYGEMGSGPIPPNATLIFTVELVAVNDAPVATPSQ
jgi:FKBP-type peptidyl-prolyl cis-trans isomerase